MAINIETLKVRALTALVFVSVMIAGLFWNEWTFIALFTLIHFGCWFEFIKLVKKINGKDWLLYAGLGLLYITLPVICMLLLRFTHIPAPQPGMPVEMLRLLPFLFPCTIIAAIWINDTMAYLVGSVIGKTPFSKISPKKTWEGTGGGAVLCVVTIALIGYHSAVGQVMAVHHWIMIAVICAVFGTAGDLLESKIKRMAEVKDSGSIMPGHGGFLDRFDSLLVAAPFVWLYIKLFV